MTTLETLFQGDSFVSLPRGVKVITARQAKAARAVLGLSVASLATKSGLSDSSIRRIEGDQDSSIKIDLAMRLQIFFERRHFTFTWDGKECGVRWPL